MSLTDLPGLPFWVAPVRIAPNGVDHIGIRQANFDLMDTVLPGINNVTRHVRPFSIMAWVFWKADQLTQQQGNVTPSQVIAFQERVEVLFTWGHKRDGATGLPGLRSNPPAAEPDGSRRLTFRAWGRNHGNGSLLSATQYGPASKPGRGLGLLEPTSRGLHAVRGHGIALAKALDEQLRKAGELYEKLLNTLEERTGTEEDADALLPFWRVGETTEIERKAFLDAFEAPQRAPAIRLLRRGLLREAGTLRARVAAAGVEANDDEERTAGASWLVLQLRQAQRFALDSLFAAAFDLAADSGGATVDEAVAEFRRAWAGDQASNSSLLRSRWETLSKQFGSIEDLRSSFGYNQVCPLATFDQIRQDVWKLGAHATLQAVLDLAVSAARWGIVLGQNEEYQQPARIGGGTRLSLVVWGREVEHRIEAGDEAFLRWLLTDVVVSRHVATAAARSVGGAQRLRLVIDDGRLTRFGGAPGVPFTADRLDCALSLLKECNAA